MHFGWSGGNTRKPFVELYVLGTMNSFSFQINLGSVEKSQECIVHFDRGIFYVYLDGRQIGMMVRDRSEDFGYYTNDDSLTPLLEEISAQLSEKLNKDSFVSLMTSMWDEIIKTEFQNEHTLYVYLVPDADLDVFLDRLNDWKDDYVEFNDTLEIVLLNINGDRTIRFFIN